MASQPLRKRTGFLDLSAELRNRIYDLALTNGADKTALEIEVPEASKYHCKKRKQRLCLSHEDLSPNILATCKQINQEATPMLYGNLIKCHLDDPSKFFGRIKRSIRFLRILDLTLDIDEKKEAPSIAAAKSLVNLTMSVSLYRWPLEPKIFQYILTLARVIRANRLREGMEADLRDCIKFQVWGMIYTYWDLLMSHEQDQIYMIYQDRLFSMLEKELGITREVEKSVAKNAGI